jgi:hypothetical protein
VINHPVPPIERRRSLVEVKPVPEIKKEESDPLLPLICPKCLGNKFIKKDKICLQCGGEGVLKGELFNGLAQLINAET